MKTNKLSRLQFGFLMFNYVVGFGFISTVGEIISLNSYGLVAFLAVSLIALGVLIIFSKLAEKYQNVEGSSYGFSKQVDGKYMSFFQGWNQYIQGPVLSASTPLFLQVILNEEWPDLSEVWRWVSILLFILFIVLSALRIKYSFKAIAFFASFKWVILLFAFVLIIYQSITNNYFSDSFASSSKVTAITIAGSMLSFMYAYGGIEGITTLTKDTKKEGLRKMYFTVFFLIMFSYLVFYIFLLGAIKISEADTQIIKTVFNASLGIAGVSIFIIGTIGNKASSITSSSIVNARNLGPMAEDGYFPKFIGKKNSRGVYATATFVSAAISIVSMIIFELLPEYLDMGNAFINVIQIGTITFLVQYLFTGITALKLERKGTIGFKWWERTLIWFMFLIIAFILIVQVVPPILGGEWEVRNIVILIAYPSWIALGYCLWFFNYLYNKHKKQS